MHQPCTEGGLTDKDVLHLFNFNTATYLDSYFSRGRLFLRTEISRKKVNSLHSLFGDQSKRTHEFKPSCVFETISAA